MRNVITEFVGVSIFMLPLTLLISWVLFRASYKGNSDTRIPLILGVCLVATLGVITIRQYGGQRGYTFTPADWVNLLDGVIVAIFGVAFWGKSQSNRSSRPDM
jgi:hypothetical protein